MHCAAMVMSPKFKAEEILIWATLLHENICPLLGVFGKESELFFVYEHGENGTLREWRHTLNPSGWDVLGRVSLMMYYSSMVAAHIFLELLEVAKAIQHMHLSGIYLYRTIDSVRTCSTCNLLNDLTRLSGCYYHRLKVLR
jgi:serine/threonine protein kinase